MVVRLLHRLFCIFNRLEVCLHCVVHYHCHHFVVCSVASSWAWWCPWLRSGSHVGLIFVILCCISSYFYLRWRLVRGRSTERSGAIPLFTLLGWWEWSKIENIPLRFETTQLQKHDHILSLMFCSISSTRSIVCRCSVLPRHFSVSRHHCLASPWPCSTTTPPRGNTVWPRPNNTPPCATSDQPHLAPPPLLSLALTPLHLASPPLLLILTVEGGRPSGVWRRMTTSVHCPGALPMTVDCFVALLAPSLVLGSFDANLGDVSCGLECCSSKCST
jgi:hypothetical protein